MAQFLVIIWIRYAPIATRRIEVAGEHLQSCTNMKQHPWQEKVYGLGLGLGIRVRVRVRETIWRYNEVHRGYRFAYSTLLVRKEVA